MKNSFEFYEDGSDGDINYIDLQGWLHNNLRNLLGVDEKESTCLPSL